MIGRTNGPAVSRPTQAMPDETQSHHTPAINLEQDEFQGIEKLDDEEKIIEILARSVGKNTFQHVPTFSEIFRLDSMDTEFLPNHFKLIKGKILFYWQSATSNLGRPGQHNAFDEITINHCRIGIANLTDGSKHEFSIEDSYPNPYYPSDPWWRTPKIPNDFKLNDVLVVSEPNYQKIILAGGGKNNGGGKGLRITDETFDNYAEYFNYTAEHGIKKIVRFNKNFYVAITKEMTCVLDMAFNVVSSVKKGATCIAVSNSNWIAISSEASKTIKIYSITDLGTLVYSHKWTAHTSSITSLLLLPGGYLASAGGGSLYCTDGSIKIWDISNGRLISSLEPKAHLRIQKLDLLPNGWICSSTSGYDIDNPPRINIWDLDNKKLIKVEDGDWFDVTPDYLVIYKKNWIEKKIEYKFISISSKNPKDYAYITDSETLSDNRKFRLFQFHNRLKLGGKKADFSSKKLIDRDVAMLVKLLKYNIYITELNLSENELTSASLIAITQFLRTNKVIKKLILNKVNMNTYGFNIFEDYLLESKGELEHLDLTDNKIELSRKELYKAKRKLKTSGCVIDLSLNYLAKDCSDLVTDQNITFQTTLPTFFRSKAKTSTSQFDPSLPLTLTRWVVSLVVEKASEHAFILLEGVHPNGQILLEKYDIEPITTPGKAKVRRIVASPSFYVDRENFVIQPHKINSIQGKTLRGSVMSIEGSEIGFAQFDCTSVNKVNCVNWCIYQLANIEINIPIPLIPWPTNVARGRSARCVIS